MSTGPILIVDDEPQVRSTLAEALEFGGYDVDCAESANEALEKLSVRHFPVILTDMNMPGGPSGLDLLSEVHSRNPNIMVVIITGFATLDSAVGALKRGAYDFIQKPFKISEIEAVLDRALEHSRVLKELNQYHEELEKRVLTRTQEFRDFHREVLALNELTLRVAGELDPATLTDPFLDYIFKKVSPAAAAVLVLSEGGWSILRSKGGLWPLHSLPPPQGIPDHLELAHTPWAEAYLLRLGGEETVGGLLLGFVHRSSFYPEEPVVALWRRQLGALLVAREKVLRQLSTHPKPE
jgi:two-component system NtrC family response regulator/two-component system response regulator PilR (NtrC family)